MIDVEYLGRLGNKMFQYCLGRILATEFGWSLRAAALDGFARTGDAVHGARYSGPPVEVTDDGFDLPSLLSDRQPRKIRLRGYFQKHAVYRPYQSIIREWLDLGCTGTEPAPGDAVVVNVRRTDYVELGWALPFAYYEEAIRKSKARRVIIVTDAPGDPFFRSFASFKPRFFRGSPIAQFAFMTSARALVMSQSTFSWWPTFLGNMENVFCPIPVRGIWAPDSTAVDLIEKDRFHCIACGEYIPTSAEARYQQIRLLRNRVKSQVVSAVRRRLRWVKRLPLIGKRFETGR